MLHWIGHFLAPSMHDKLSWGEKVTMADTNNTHLTRPILVQKPFYSLTLYVPLKYKMIRQLDCYIFMHKENVDGQNAVCCAKILD